MKIDRPSGYIQSFDPQTFRRLEGETRQCVHCAFTWIYNPRDSFGSLVPGEQKKSIRGKCLKCYGLVCARPECMALGCINQNQLIDSMEKKAKLGGRQFVVS